LTTYVIEGYKKINPDTMKIFIDKFIGKNLIQDDLQKMVKNNSKKKYERYFVNGLQQQKIQIKIFMKKTL
jgi:hypothetical protein